MRTSIVKKVGPFLMACLTTTLLGLPKAFADDKADLETRIAQLENAPRLSLFQTVTEMPSTGLKVVQRAFTRETVKPWLIILGSTGVLYYYDEEILQNVQHAGRDMGIGNGDATKSVITLGGKDILRLPSDTGSALYFLGDGWMHMSIASGFLLNGYFGDKNRPFNTGVEIIHGMFVSTFFNQALKRSFGREDPNFQSKKRGRWRPFPKTSDYNKTVAKYDAMPSGHIMTATLTFTIINTNYPEYSSYVLPLAGVWLTALGFEMVNNGVHWASDYPLGIAMGYFIGKIATEMGRPEPKTDEPEKPKFVYYPTMTDEGPLLNAAYLF